VEGEIQPQGFFYAVNLRTHSTALLDIARPTRKKAHRAGPIAFFLVLFFLLTFSPL